MPQESRQPPRAACDRCHLMKEKCVYESSSLDTDPTCSRCSKIAKPCTVARRKQSKGRPRKADTTPLQPRAGTEFVWRASRDEPSALSSRSKTKSRSNPQVASRQDYTTTADPTAWPANKLLACRSASEIMLLQAMFANRDRGSASRPTFIDGFILGPSFAEAELGTLFATLSSFPEAADALLSGFLACSGRFFALVHVDHEHRDGVVGATRAKRDARMDSYVYSARAVKELRELEKEDNIKSGEAQHPRGTRADPALALVLGLGVVTFDLLDSGLYAHSICRYTLGLMGRSSPSGGGAEFDGHLLPLIYMDSCNCLVRRQVPAYRLRPRQPETVDRYIGLCVSLLPVIYDLCCVCQSDGNGTIDGNGGGMSGAGVGGCRGLLEVETAVRNWSPSLSKEDAAKLTSREVQVIITQATVYHTAVLLFIHRLHFPFGMKDDMAASMACSVLDDIQSLYAPGQDQNSDPFEYRLGLPFLIAAAELQGGTQRARALELLDLVIRKRMYLCVGDLLGRFIVHIWEARDRDWQGHWVDLTAHGPQFVLF